MTDEQLENFLHSDDKTFHNTLNFNSRNFYDWVKEADRTDELPVFRRGQPYRRGNALTGICDFYFNRLVEHSLEYPIGIHINNVGRINIVEKEYLDGKARFVYDSEGNKTQVIDDYFVKYPGFKILFTKPSFGEITPLICYNHSRKKYAKTLRQVAIKHSKGNFYPSIEKK